MPIAVLSEYTEKEYEPFDPYSRFYPAMPISVCFSDTALCTLGKIRVWVEEYEPEAKVSALHPKRDAEVLSDELVSFVQNKIDGETREWLSGPFTNLVNDKVESLKDSLEGRLEEFFVSLDQVKVSVTGSHNIDTEDIPVWKRVVAAGGGILIGDIGVAALGATTGLSSEFAKGIALQLGAYIGLAILGILNPFTIIAVIAASVIRGGLKVSEKAVKNAKEQVAATFCEEISGKSMQLVDTVVSGATENFDKIKDIISKISTNTKTIFTYNFF